MQVKFGTQIILAASIIVGVIYFMISTKSLIDLRNAILFGVVTFLVITWFALKVDTGAKYSAFCLSGDKNVNYWRVAHVLFPIGDLVNVVAFHTCNKK